MTRILITGFGPFPGAPVNPTERIVAGILRARRPNLAAHEIATHVFATSYAAVDRDLPALLKKHRPDILIMFGLAARTKHLRIEMLARNRRSALHPDQEGVVASSLAIENGELSAARGRAPFARLLGAARENGIHARLSRDAGRYLCNYVYWRALEATTKKDGPKIVLFVHVPKLRSRGRRRTGKPLPTLPQLVNAANSIVIAAKAALPRH